jgi:hypothetical protein
MYDFGFWSAFSAMMFYDQLPYQLYNLIMTTFPILWVSVFDLQYEKDAPPQDSEGKKKEAAEEKKLSDKQRELQQRYKTDRPWNFFMINPHLYKIGLNSECYDQKMFLGYLCYGLWAAFSVYCTVYLVMC